MSMDCFKMPLSHCPICTAEIDGAAAVFDGKGGPRKGDITFCLRCGAILVFTEDLKVRSMREEEVDGLPDEVIHFIMHSVRILKEIIKDRALNKAMRN